jgi:hypothetical protein
MGKSLHLSKCVYRIDPDTESRALALAFGVAGVSFASSLTIAALDAPSGLLIWASYCFAAALPISLFQAFLSLFVLRGGWSTGGSRTLSVLTGHTAHLSVCGGVFLVFLHISGIAASILLSAGGLLWIFSVIYARIYGTTCARLEEREQENPGLPDIQPPLEPDKK